MIESRFQRPAIVAVVNHLAGHATIDADVLAGNESGLVATKKKNHIGYVHGVPYPAYGLLRGIGTTVEGVGGVYPSGRNRVHPGTSGKAHGQGMCQCSKPPLAAV